VFYIGGVSVAHFIGSVVFLVGLGLFMGTCVRTVTMAALATLAIYVGVRMVISPLLLGLTMLLGAAASGASGGNGGVFLIGSTIFSAAVYVGSGLLLARAAAARVRQNVFS
jgi:hypothetical protein